MGEEEEEGKGWPEPRDQQCNRQKETKYRNEWHTCWWKICDHFDFFERNDLLDRRIIFKLVGRTWTDVWALELSVWARRDANFSSTCVERGARRCVGEKRRDVDREIWFLFLACTHSNPLFSSFSPSRSISIVPLTLILLIRSFSLSSYMHSLVLVLTLSHNTRKMQRITIFFLSPFVYNVESTFRGSFSIFTRAV